jgi:hypothetical protein
MAIKVKASVFLGRRGYMGIVRGSIGGRTIWIERTGVVRRDIMTAYTDAQLVAARVQA